MSKINPKVWPIGITLSIMTVAGMCVHAVYVAEGLPVHMDNTYFADYRDVDLNVNEMIMKQKEFDAKYTVDIEKKDFIIGENSVTLKVTDKEKNGVDTAQVDLLITRPHTSFTDKKLEVTSTQNGVYTFEPFEIKDLGRWHIQSKIAINDLVSYGKLEVNATN
ncbi:MAG: FixH family protein [Epsilonproteobacteria bacterium]|nr:FixH family protein [Campylobacterota bacterium]